MPKKTLFPLSIKYGGFSLIAAVIIVSLIAVLAGGGYYLVTHRNEVSRTENGTVKTEIGTPQYEFSDEQGTFVVGEGVKIPSGFSKDIPVYPKGKITSAFTGQDEFISDGITQETTDDPVTVTNWYREELQKKGWEITAEDQYGIVAQIGDITGSLVVAEVDKITSISFSTGKMPTVE